MEENDIAKIIEKEYSLDDLFKRTRLSVYVEARALFFWILKHKMNKSYYYIEGKYKYNHATVIYNVRRIEGQMQFDKIFKRKIENILEKVCLD